MKDSDNFDNHLLFFSVLLKLLIKVKHSLYSAFIIFYFLFVYIYVTLNFTGLINITNFEWLLFDAYCYKNVTRTFIISY